MHAAHWTRLVLTYEGAIEALQGQGIEPSQATAESLHAFDMLHMGNLSATDKLADLAGIRAGWRVLDAGSGVGGPARRFADKYGASVTGIELTESSYQTSIRLTELVGLQDRVSFVHGSILALPFDEGEFDAVVMAHVAMQISEKETLFGELARVLKPGGILALHEIFGTRVGEPHYPLAWADVPAMSALETFDQCSARLTGQGFNLTQVRDESEAGRLHHVSNIAKRKAALERADEASVTAEGLTAEVTDVRLKQAMSMERNLREGRLQVMMVVAQKAG